MRIFVNFVIYIVVKFSCIRLCWMRLSCKIILFTQIIVIFSLCVILLSSHSFGCWRALDVCHDILITTFPFLGQQKCFCYNFADAKMKFFSDESKRRGCISVWITMSSCQQENQVQRHYWRQEKIYKRMKKFENKLSINVSI